MEELIMPVIKTWCLPQMEESDLNQLHNAIVSAVVSIEELGLKNESDITNLFVPDLMEYGLGTEIVVEVCGLFIKPERTQDVRNRLAEVVGKAVKNLFPNAKKVECLIYPFDPVVSGFWSSN